MRMNNSTYDFRRSVNSTGGGLRNGFEALFAESISDAPPIPQSCSDNKGAAEINIGIPFVRAGNAIFTVDNGKGAHYTYRVSRKETVDGRVLFFVGLLTGPDNLNSYSYVGLLTDANECKLTRKSRFRAEDKAIKIVNWALRVMAGKSKAPAGYSIQHSGRCGMCSRVLTEPESLRVGIGPVCREKL